ncbi:class I SAM-dependent methyltransferase [Thermoactinospora rubra]|uniref:class I SAM-dependent methyltransferase n=1 Tax=Thermoactinospora rubra TaxID=1088767 RepID=UPI000A121476|nr:class I SAM-dependent methyltransferase [Thermoactinospora rubra]
MEITSWAVDRPIRSQAALPHGPLGRLMGRVMLWTNRQEEVLRLLRVEPGQEVLEVGYGPGGLVRLLRGTGAGRICGVDPSPDMRAMAMRQADERVELKVGTAEDTGYPPGSFDRVVSVNNAPLWPDLEAGVRELRRVLRPGGLAVIAWHGGTRPSRLDRRLRLPEDKLARIERALGESFGSVRREELTTLTAFVATAT